jgi:16S rRNA (adenine1518-N6/adenine1519-N6)-dimethyltransferase
MDFLDRQTLSRPAQFLLVLFLPAVYIPGAWPWMGSLLVVVSLALALGTRGRRSHLALVAFAGALLVLAWGLRAGFPTRPFWPFVVSGTASGLGTVVAEAPINRSGTAAFKFLIEEIRHGDWTGRAKAQVTVLGYHGSSPATGSRWFWSGRLDPSGTLIWKSGTARGWAAGWWEGRALVRQFLIRSLEPLGAEASALGQALLIGAVDDLTPWEKDSFRQAGVSHVLALSGMHLSLLALVLTAAFQRRAPPAAVFVVIQTLLGLFCFLAGPIPSLWRAWVMAFLGGWWVLTARPVPLRELLSQSFLVSVLLWPDMAASLSLQLSFLALAGLFLWSQAWERAWRPWMGRWTASNLAASAAAMAATIPLTLTLFGEVRWIGLVMTPPLVFLTTVYLLGTVAVLAVALIPGFDSGFLSPVFQFLYDVIFACTAWGSRFPALGFPAAVCVGVGGLGAAFFFLYNKRHRRASLPVSLNYDSPASLQGFLDDRGYNALKRWGQNFLINSGARRQILAALDLKPGEPVWEVGPGLGALTHHLVEAGHPLTVFEIDPGYAGFLREEFGGSPAGFKVVEGDVVKTWRGEPRAGVKTVGNLPYNAASAIIAQFIEEGFFPEIFVATVQLEMAQRMTALVGTKNHSSFSVLCQSAFTVEDVVTLKPGSFYPAPEVTSRVVRLRPHGLYPGLDHKAFSVFVRECFSSRRKTLRNNLPGAALAIHRSDEVLAEAFASTGVDLGLRAEALSVAKFVAVFQRLAP